MCMCVYVCVVVLVSTGTMHVCMCVYHIQYMCVVLFVSAGTMPTRCPAGMLVFDMQKNAPCMYMFVSVGAGVNGPTGR